MVRRDAHPVTGHSIGWGRVALLLFIGSLGPATIGQFLPTIGLYAGQQALSPSIAGLILSLPSIIPALLGGVVGRLAGRGCERTLMQIALLSLLLGNVLPLVSDTLPVMVVGRMLEGVGYVGLMVPGAALLMRMTTGKLLAVGTTMWGAMPSIALGIAALLVPLESPLRWQTGFVYLAILTPIGFLGTLVMPSGGVARADPGTAAPSVGLNGRVLALGVAFGVAAGLQTGASALIAPHVIARGGLSLSQASLLTTVFLFLGAGATASVGLLTLAGVSSVRLAFGSAVVTALGVTGMFWPTMPLAGMALAVLCLGVGLGILAGTSAVLVPAVAPSPEAIGATAGTVLQIALAGVLLGPPCLFAVSAHLGETGVAIAVLVADLCATLLLYGLVRAPKPAVFV